MWSTIGVTWHYNEHATKTDRVELSQSKDLGYELQAAVLVSDRSGDPLSAISLSLRAADGVHCSRQASVRQPLSLLDELAPAMDYVERQALGMPAVHIIDREADSVGHYRQWIEHPGRYFLVRADTERVVEHEGQQCPLTLVRERLREQNSFRKAREVSYRGQTAWQWVTETRVVLTKPARPQRRDGQPRQSVLC